jgi:hypothetical protein
MSYEDPGPWTPLQRAMALSVAQTVGTLPEGKLRPLLGTPRRDRDAEMARHPLVKVRVLTGDRFYKGRVAGVGEVITLPDYEARAWIQLKWATKVIL